MHPYWLLGVETGARTSEVLALAWNDLDLERGTLTLGRRVVRLLKETLILKADAKTAASRRTIRLTAGMLAELDRYRFGRWNARKLAGGPDWNPQGLFFTTASGLLVNPAHVRRSFDRLIGVAGVKRITPHGMRKRHITHAIAAGGTPKAVAVRAGRRDVNTTLQTYTRVVPQMEEEPMRIVEVLNPARLGETATG